MKKSILPALSLLTLASLCAAQPIGIVTDNPVSIIPTALNSTVSFTFPNSPLAFHGIGLASTADYALAINSWFGNPGSNAGGIATEFVIAPATSGFNPTNSPGIGFCSPFGSTFPHAPAVLERVSPQIVSAANSLLTSSLGAGHVMKVVVMTVSGGAPYELLVTGDPSLRWFLFNSGSGAPFDSWRRRIDRIAEGPVGGNPFTGFPTDTYALVVTRDAGVASVNLPFTVRMAPTSSHLNFAGPGTSISGITHGSRQFTTQPLAGRWNGVGAPSYSIAGLSSTIFMGGAQQSASTAPGFVLANGRLGTIVPNDGLLSFTAVQQGQTTSLHQSSVQLMSVGTPGTKSWAASDFMHIFEFEVLSSGFYDLNVSAPSGLGSQVFTPGTSSDWRPRSAGLPGSATQNLVQLAPGWHAIVVFKSVPTSTPSGPVTCSVSPSPNNPVAVLNSISPTSANAGGAGFTLTASGSQFVSGSSVIRWNGTALPTTFVNAGQLTASISASLVAAGGTANVTVFNDAPGGGSSSTLSFSIVSAAPTLSSLSPASALAGTSAFTLNLNGSGFHPGTVVFWNFSSLTSTFVSGSQLTVNVSASLISVPGSADVQVFNGSPGGGLTSALAFPILGPTISSLSLASIPILTATSQPVNFLISGADFLPNAQAFADSSPLPTTVFGSSLIQASVGPAVLGALKRGAVAIAVQNSPTTPSNAIALPVGGGSNQGTIVRHPLNPNPGQAYGVALENGAPIAPFLLIVDVLNPTPVFPFPDPAANFVLSVRPVGPGQPNWFLLIDSIGVYGTAFGPTYDASGKVLLSGFAAPNPTIGISLTVQGAFLDPTAINGYRITWPRFPDIL